MKTWVKEIHRLGACTEAIRVLERHDSIQDWWATCDRGDWMLWLLGKLSGKPETDSRKKLVLTTCQCARLSLQYVQEKETRPLQAIETAEAYARGKSGITIDDVMKAAHAASDASDAAYAASDAAYAAAHAASDAAYAAAHAAHAAYAAAYAAYVAYAASDATARSRVLKQCADIVRRYYPAAPVTSPERRRRKGGKLNIYLISQDVNKEYDTYDSAVVIAENEDDARIIHPGCTFDNFYTWANPNNVKVKLVGTALPDLKRGVVCASFNAG